VLHRLHEKNRTTDSGARAIEDAMVINDHTDRLIEQRPKPTARQRKSASR
jgi:hypothetical protein